MIPDEVVERVRESADIVQIIGEYVNLKRVGTDFRGPCPFHQGTHRNFSVSARKGIYYCFVCHEGGDVFAFLQKRLGLDWPSAVRQIAQRVGIEVPESDGRRDAPDPREPLWEANAAADEFFRRTLWESEEGRQARDYLASREVSRELAERAGLGFAPRDPARLGGYLNGLGYDDARLKDAGLLVERERDGGTVLRPRFRDRLMFPILDVSGRCVGFGGRLLGPGEPKYLNSAESPVFSKGRLLYGLHWARGEIRRDDRVLLVEGYFDVVRLLGAGIATVVAPLGTALTETQAALIVRYTKNVFLLYDSDQAGLRATFRAADELLRHGASVRVVTLPEGEDPDTFVARHGRDRLEQHVAGAIDVLERKVQLLERAGWFSDLHRKRRALDRLLPTIRAAADPLTKDLYLARAAEAAGVAKEVLARELGDAPRPGGGAARARPASSGGGGRPQRSEAGPGAPDPERVRRGDRRSRYVERAFGAERDLVRVMLHVREQVEAIAERYGPDAFRDEAYRAIFEVLLRLGPDAGLDEVAAALGEDEVRVMQELLNEPEAAANPARVIDDSFARLRERELRDRATEIDRAMTVADSSQKDGLLGEKMAIVRELQALGGKRFKAFGGGAS